MGLLYYVPYDTFIYTYMKGFIKFNVFILLLLSTVYVHVCVCGGGG